MKTNSTVAVVAVFLLLTLLAYLSIFEVAEFLAKQFHDYTYTLFEGLVILGETMRYLGLVIIAYSAIITFLSFILLYIYSKKGKKGLKNGFMITSIISGIWILYLILALIFGW